MVVRFHERHALLGLRFRVLNIIDEGVREALDIVVDTSITARRLVRVLDLLKSKRGVPKAIGVDNCPEMTAQVFADWCRENGVRILYIQPRLPEPKRLYRKIQSKLLRGTARSAHLLDALSGARPSLALLISYKERPHSSLGNIPPAEFKRRIQAENSILELCH